MVSSQFQFTLPDSKVFFARNLLYRGIRNPVQQLVIETEKIKNFDLRGEVDIKASFAELETLITAVGDMKIGLQSFQKSGCNRFNSMFPPIWSDS